MVSAKSRLALCLCQLNGPSWKRRICHRHAGCDEELLIVSCRKAQTQELEDIPAGFLGRGGEAAGARIVQEEAAQRIAIPKGTLANWVSAAKSRPGSATELCARYAGSMLH